MIGGTRRRAALTAALRALDCLICGAAARNWCDPDCIVPAPRISTGPGAEVHVPRVLSAVALGHVSAGVLAAQFPPGQVPAWLSSPVRR